MDYCSNFTYSWVPFEITPCLCWLQGWSISVERAIIFQTVQRSQALSLAQGTAIMYQGYTLSQEGDCQALGLVVYQLAKICYRLRTTRCGLLKPKTLRPWHQEKAIIKMVRSLLAYFLGHTSLETQTNFSVSFTWNGDNWLISTSTELIGNKVTISCLSRSRTHRWHETTRSKSYWKAMTVSFTIASINWGLYIAVDGANRVVGQVNNDLYVWKIIPKGSVMAIFH